MESSSLSDITKDQCPWALADASEGIEINQEHQDEEKYKNGWYFFILRINDNIFVRIFSSL